MGQQEVKTSKISKNNAEFPTIEILPSSLKIFGELILIQKPSKVGPKKFLLAKSKDNEFTIITSNDADDLASYQGFLEVSEGANKIFSGNVNKLRREGFGVEFDLDGRVFYRGEFSNDTYHGWGQTVRYKGEFKGGRKQGWGRWEDHDRNISYEGSFKEDKPHGLGYLNLHPQQIPAFMKSDRPLDQTDKVTKRYAGEWTNGRIHGSGKLATMEEVYQGGFADGVYSGEGVLNRGGRIEEGKFYQGELV